MKLLAKDRSKMKKDNMNYGQKTSKVRRNGYFLNFSTPLSIDTRKCITKWTGASKIATQDSVGYC